MDEATFFVRVAAVPGAVDLVRDLGAQGLEPFRLSPVKAIALGEALVRHGRRALAASHSTSVDA